MRYLLALLLTACVHLPHMEPQPRSPLEVWRSSVTVESACGDFDRTHMGSGVMISERHVVTAAHIVRCGYLPSVLVSFPTSGWRRYMVVDRDEQMFGDGRDIARLEIRTAQNFEVGVTPPRLAPPDWTGNVVALLPDGSVSTGYLVDKDFVSGMMIELGASGTGVYTMSGLLVGIIVARGSSGSYIERLDASWLEGT